MDNQRNKNQIRKKYIRQKIVVYPFRNKTPLQRCSSNLNNLEDSQRNSNIELNNKYNNENRYDNNNQNLNLNNTFINYDELISNFNKDKKNLIQKISYLTKELENLKNYYSIKKETISNKGIKIEELNNELKNNNKLKEKEIELNKLINNNYHYYIEQLKKLKDINEQKINDLYNKNNLKSNEINKLKQNRKHIINLKQENIIQISYLKTEIDKRIKDLEFINKCNKKKLFDLKNENDKLKNNNIIIENELKYLRENDIVNISKLDNFNILNEKKEKEILDLKNEIKSLKYIIESENIKTNKNNYK